MQKSLYFDFGATTPIDTRVLAAMQPYLTEHFGNSQSQSHTFGWSASEGIEKARKQIASCIGCESNEVFFTSGATESNNWAIRGVIDYILIENPGQPIHVISAKTEHASVVKSLEALEQMKIITLDWAKVDQHGRVDVKDVELLLKPNTKLISIMWVNNELGTVNPIAELAKLTRDKKIYFHCDATHAIGKVKVDIQETQLDLLTASAHKFYGPKGVGFLYIRSRNPKVSISPLLHGGGHEKGFRSGTVNTAGVVGMGVACEIVKNDFESDQQHLFKIRNNFIKELSQSFPSMQINTDPEHFAPHVLSLTFVGCKLPEYFTGLAISSGSACQSGSVIGSRVLHSIGFSPDLATKTIRISFGRMTTMPEVELAIAKLRQGIQPGDNKKTSNINKL